MFTLTVQNQAGEIEFKQQFSDASLVIGRDVECDIILNSNGVSRKHARLFTQHQRCFIEDLKSANGIIVDGQRVVGQRDLGAASQIQIGDHFLFLHLSDSRFDIGATLFVSDDSQHSKLVRIADAFAGEEYSLSELCNTIGRTDDNFILLSDTSISRNHSEIQRIGNRYSIADLGSSNGTRVNGKKLKKSAELQYGDRIRFGNLRFIFVEGGTEISPEQLKKKKPRSIPLLIISGLLVFALILLGLFAFFLQKSPVTKKLNETTPQAKVAPQVIPKIILSIDKSKALIAKKEFPAAIHTLENHLIHSPDDADAKGLLEEAKKEQSAVKLVEEANSKIEGSDYVDAIKLLKSVKSDTLTYPSAQTQLKKITRLLAFNIKMRADKLILNGSKASLRKAHKLYIKALSTYPDEKSWRLDIRRLEATLAENKIRFKKWRKPKKNKTKKVNP